MMDFVMTGEYFYILKLRFIEPVHKILYVLLEKDSNDNIFDINNDIQTALCEKNIVAASSVFKRNNNEFDEWYSVAYSEAVLRVCKKPLHFLKHMVLRGLEGRAKLGLEISDIILVYHSTEGIVDTYLKSIQNLVDKTEEETMSDKVSPATSMSTEYWILRVNHLQKVCYIILGDVPGFKVLKIVDEIHSYFDKNNIDIFTACSPVSFSIYRKWLCLLVSEDLIEINLSGNKVFDASKLSTLKSHVTSIKYELEIEPNATIRTYNYATLEMIFNEWFNDASPSDKRKEKETSDNRVSPFLSKIEKRIEQLKQLEHDNDNIELKIQQHKNALEELSFGHDELSMDIAHVHDRIHHLCDQAIIGEGFTREYIRRFLKERGYQQY